ncbi:MAG: TatD family hydrolase [Deltaproteobacteria bacterium]
MELFDSHAHYDDKRFAEDYDEVILNAFNSGVKYILNAGSDIATSKKSIELAEKYDFIYAAAGVHPHEVEKLGSSDYEELKKLCGHHKVVAVGEIGLDYFYDYSPREIQKQWFTKQVELSKELNMPIIIHNRDSHEDMMNIVRKYAPYLNSGVFHCFAGSWEMAKELLELGFYISFGGSITFKNAKKSVEILEKMPENRILIETDCPYLTPEPFRGQRNHSGYVRLVAEKISQIRGVPIEEIAKTTTENTKRLFGIK